MKRANENSQIRREEYDKLDEQESVAGTFKRASEEVLRQRRIVKARRPPSLRPVEPKISPASNGNQSLAEEPSPANPFAEISLVNGSSSISPSTKPFVKSVGSTSMPSTAQSGVAVGMTSGNLDVDPGSRKPEEEVPKETTPVDEAVGDAESASEEKLNERANHGGSSVDQDNTEKPNLVVADRSALDVQPDAEENSK